MTSAEALKRLREAKAAGQVHRGLPSIARALGLSQGAARRALEAGLVQRAVLVRTGVKAARGCWIAARPELRQLALPFAERSNGSV